MQYMSTMSKTGLSTSATTIAQRSARTFSCAVIRWLRFENLNLTNSFTTIYAWETRSHLTEQDVSSPAPEAVQWLPALQLRVDGGGRGRVPAAHQGEAGEGSQCKYSYSPIPIS